MTNQRQETDNRSGDLPSPFPVKSVRGPLPTPEMRALETELRRQLAELHQAYRRAAEPILQALQEWRLIRHKLKAMGIDIDAPPAPEGEEEG